LNYGIGKDDSRKDAKDAKFQETVSFFFALLAPWREKISLSGSVKHLKGRIQQFRRRFDCA
jgi:hypothetical protein